MQSRKFFFAVPNPNKLPAGSAAPLATKKFYHNSSNPIFFCIFESSKNRQLRQYIIN